MSTLILGTFDGVHVAHRQLIDEALSQKEAVIACTFDAPYSKAPLLTLFDEKLALLKEAGVKDVYINSFSDIKDMPCEEYIRMLNERFKPRTIITGFNHRFGKNAAGTPATLYRLGGELGFTVKTILPVKDGDRIVSSTLIRSILLEGSVDEAARLLGRRYSLSGVTVHGKAIGTKIDFPTVNTAVDAQKLVPASGVYATLVKYNGRIYRGMTNIGTNPTVSDHNPATVETHIFAFNEDIYGKSVEIFFVKRVRDDKKFSSVSELKNQLINDAVLINAYFDTLR